MSWIRFCRRQTRATFLKRSRWRAGIDPIRECVQMISSVSESSPSSRSDEESASSCFVSHRDPFLPSSAATSSPGATLSSSEYSGSESASGFASTALLGTRSFPSQPLLFLSPGLFSPSCRGEGLSSTSSMWWPGDRQPSSRGAGSGGAGMVNAVRVATRLTMFVLGRGQWKVGGRDAKFEVLGCFVRDDKRRAS